MKQLTCEMCGSTDLMKQDGVFVCQTCGTKYSVEEAKRMMIEGTVDVQGTVKVDSSDELKNLYQLARRAKNDGNSENAQKYYEMILVKAPECWEATFYAVYYKAMGCKIVDIQTEIILVTNCIGTVLKLIEENIESREERIKAYKEVAGGVLDVADMLFIGAKKHWGEMDPSVRMNYWPKLLDITLLAAKCAYVLGDQLDLLFCDEEEANQLAVVAWRQGIETHSSNGEFAYKENHRQIIHSYVAKIQKYNSSYVAPANTTSKGGCYVATAVYGSYDCPQVWTLRRYRDYTLAETWHGRAFIKTYYAISPTIVKWFGETEWFKKLWKGKLDKMVSNLQKNGVESTPYEDRNW